VHAGGPSAFSGVPSINGINTATHVIRDDLTSAKRVAAIAQCRRPHIDGELVAGAPHVRTSRSVFTVAEGNEA
jgi:hypothetical protein